MDKYESVCVLSKDCTNEQLSEMMVKIQNKIAEFSNEEINIKNMGKKTLAYQVKNNKEGFFFVINFQAKSKDLNKLINFYRITEKVLKYMVIKEE